MYSIITGGIFFLTAAPSPVIPPEQIYYALQPSTYEEVLRINEKDNFLISTSENVQLKVPFIHQYENLPQNRQAEIGYSACGPTSLTMAFQYEGIETNLIEVIDKLPPSVYIKGRMFYDLYSGTELYGFKAQKIEQSPRGYFTALKNGKPVIINIQNYNGYVGHAMVVVGIIGFNQEQNTAKALIIHDPSLGGNRIFEYLTNNTLKQPEGFINYIGTLQPFILK